MILSLAACGGDKGEEKIEGTVMELLEKVVKDATNPEMSLENSEVSADNFNWIFFIDPIDGAEAAVNQPIIGSIPHEIALLRVPEGEDAEQVRKDIETNMDPRKWICVEAESTAVLRRGDLILLAMADKDTVEKVKANFLAL